MYLPPGLKKLLQSLGINAVRLEWKLRYLQERLRWERTPFARWAKVLSYQHKFCSCGLLVDKNAKVCPACGRKLHSRALYRIGRLLGFVAPEIGVAWPLLMVAVTAVFVGEFSLGGLTSLLSPSSETLVRFGAIYTPSLEAGEYWRILSAGLVHVGLLHIVFNLMALSQLAPGIEDEIGAWQFIALVTVSQIGCGCASYFLRPVVLSAGASGIAFGLIGFGLAYSHRQGGGRGRARCDLYLKWAIYGFLFGLFMGADNLGHLGGLAAGAVFGFIVPVGLEEETRLAMFWRVLAVVCLVAWGYAVFMMIRSISVEVPPEILGGAALGPPCVIARSRSLPTRQSRSGTREP